MSYTSQNGLPKTTAKFHCMVSGDKRMAPCSGCSNPKGCLSSTMQYKETEEMADKPTVKLGADGSVTCAKGLELSECGYKVGDKVCGKCGATAVAMKSLDDEWVTVDDFDIKGGSPMSNMVEDVEDEMMDETPVAKRKKARAKRMETMGVKSLDWDDDSFVCAFERKMLPGASQVCAQCPGGCAPEQDMPSLLEVEGIAEDMFSGKVLDSGYSDETDIYVVDVQRKDGKPIEAFFDGSTGECMGWHLLNDSVIGEVAEIGGTKVISFNEAAVIATKSIEGDVIAVDADMFEGYDAFAVEVEGIDGKSYDVFVGLDGEVLGWDEYDADEAEDIDAEVADLALKRMYDEETRDKMAESGEALPDGSYPIADEDDLKNAIQAYGRAKDKEAAKAHIMKRAAALELEELIPEEWSKKQDDEDMDEEDMDESEETEETTTDGEKSADTQAAKFLADLMEFEMLKIDTGLED
jgi:uncharacterized membrane protein YkoI